VIGERRSRPPARSIDVEESQYVLRTLREEEPIRVDSLLDEIDQLPTRDVEIIAIFEDVRQRRDEEATTMRRQLVRTKDVIPILRRRDGSTRTRTPEVTAK
jgi:uncharacterized protein YdcH (DUF465 family)